VAVYESVNARVALWLEGSAK
jgi:hypothetical protein